MNYDEILEGMKRAEKMHETLYDQQTGGGAMLPAQIEQQYREIQVGPVEQVKQPDQEYTPRRVKFESAAIVVTTLVGGSAVGYFIVAFIMKNLLCVLLALIGGFFISALRGDTTTARKGTQGTPRRAGAMNQAQNVQNINITVNASQGGNVTVTKS